MANENAGVLAILAGIGALAVLVFTRGAQAIGQVRLSLAAIDGWQPAHLIPKVEGDPVSVTVNLVYSGPSDVASLVFSVVGPLGGQFTVSAQSITLTPGSSQYILSGQLGVDYRGGVYSVAAGNWGIVVSVVNGVSAEVSHADAYLVEVVGAELTIVNIS